MRGSPVVVLAMGCGRIAFDAAAMPDDASMPDTDATAQTCSYGAPAMVAGPWSSVDDWFPTPALGETMLVYFSFQTPTQGGADLWMVSRPDTSAAFSSPVHLLELSTIDDERSPTLTEDALDLVFTRSTPTGRDLYTSSRASTSGSWSEPQPLAALNSDDLDGDAFLSADGLRIVFASARPGSLGAADLYESTRPDRASAFGSPRHLVELSTNVVDVSPTLAPDGREILWISERGGGPGGYDVYRATRPSLGEPFGAPALVSELSTPLDEYGLRITADGTRLYLNYATDLNGGADADPWISTRTCQ